MERAKKFRVNLILSKNPNPKLQAKDNRKAESRKKSCFKNHTDIIQEKKGRKRWPRQENG